MQEPLRVWCLSWVCLAAVARVSAPGVVSRTAAAEVAEVEDSKECMVLDLSLEPASSSLPTSLTVKPLSDWWHLKFVVGDGQAMPAACVRLEDVVSSVDLSLTSGGCDNGKTVYFGSLSPPLKLQNWTTLKVHTESDAVFLHEPQGGVAELKGLTLPQDGLQMTVTEAWGVEAAVGCAVSCPVHYYPSAGSGIKTRVREWQQQSLYFHFRPGPSFSTLHYEVKCTTQQNKVFRREVEVKLGKKDAAGDWHLVELRQRQSNATVHLNGKMLEAIQLPESCVSSMHVIWTVGDGSFGFNCTPKGAEPTTESRERDGKMHETQPDTRMHPLVSAAITFLVCVLAIACALLVWYFRQRKKKNENFNCEISSHTPTPGGYINTMPNHVKEAKGSSDSLLGSSNNLQLTQQNTERDTMTCTESPSQKTRFTSSTEDQARMTPSEIRHFHSLSADFKNWEGSTERKITPNSKQHPSNSLRRKPRPPRRHTVPGLTSCYSQISDDETGYENSKNSRVLMFQLENKAHIESKIKAPLIRIPENDIYDSTSEDDDYAI